MFDHQTDRPKQCLSNLGRTHASRISSPWPINEDLGLLTRLTPVLSIIDPDFCGDSEQRIELERALRRVEIRGVLLIMRTPW